MRRDARRAERRGLARDGRITLRRALGIATAVVAGWLLLAGPLGPASSAVRADPPTPPPATATQTPPPARTPIPPQTPIPQTPTPTATPTPTPVPSPTPTAAPTAVPTKYAESIDPQQTQGSIPPTTAGEAVVPNPHAGGSAFAEWILFTIVVCAVIAGTSFFLFFKIR